MMLAFVVRPPAVDRKAVACNISGLYRVRSTRTLFSEKDAHQVSEATEATVQKVRGEQIDKEVRWRVELDFSQDR